MPKITWKYQDGSEVSADIKEGVNLMEAAVANNINGVVGECGGNLSCATCHVYVDEAWLDKTGDVEDFEDVMLDVTEAERKPNSRLSCQIKASDSIEGVIIHVP